MRRAFVGDDVARVYRGGGRRWFTLKAAARAEAKAKIRARCDCYDGDEFTPSEPCHYHADPDRFVALVDRFAHFIVRDYRRIASPPTEAP